MMVVTHVTDEFLAALGRGPQPRFCNISNKTFIYCRMLKKIDYRDSEPPILSSKDKRVTNLVKSLRSQIKLLEL